MYTTLKHLLQIIESGIDRLSAMCETLALLTRKLEFLRPSRHIPVGAALSPNAVISQNGKRVHERHHSHLLSHHEPEIRVSGEEREWESSGGRGGGGTHLLLASVI